MSNFYTSVERFGNTILWRGYENGKRFERKVKYQPTLYITTQQKESEYQSLFTKAPIKPMLQDSMKDAKEFTEKYKGVHGLEICGNTNYVSQFIQEKYPNEIKFDPTLINIVSFDIEVDIADGYPNMDTADKEITSIAYKSSKSNTYHLLGRKGYDKHKTLTDIDTDDILWMQFDTEEAFL